MIWTCWLSFWQIETRPCGKAEPSNILALFALTWLKFIYPAKRFIVRAIHLFINRYSQATAHHVPKICLQLKLLVKLHTGACETFTHSVLLFLHSPILPCFDTIDYYQHRFSLSVWLPCWSIQSGHICHGTHIPLLWAFRILDAIVLLYIIINICCAIVFAVNRHIQVTSPVKAISGIRTCFRCAILITFDWMTVDSSDSADIQHFILSPREVLCRPSWWQRRSFWQFKCSCTIMLKDCPGCIDDLFRVRTVSFGCHLLVLTVWFLLCSMSVLAALPHLQQVVDLGHSVQFPFLQLYLHFQVIVGVCRIQCWVITFKKLVIGVSKVHYNDFFTKYLACGVWLPPADNISAKGTTGLHSDTMWYDTQYVVRNIGEISVLWVRFFLLAPPLGSVSYPKCPAILHCVGVVIIEILINLPPVLWCFRRWIQMVPGSGR